MPPAIYPNYANQPDTEIQNRDSAFQLFQTYSKKRNKEHPKPQVDKKREKTLSNVRG